MKKRVIITSACAAVALALGAGFLIRLNAYRSYKYIYPNVTCAGTDLSGLTYVQAENAIADIVSDSINYVDLTFPDGSVFRITPEQTVTETLPGTALDAAWAYGREDNSFFGPMKAFRQAKGTRLDIPLNLSYSYSEESVRAQVEDVQTQIAVMPTESQGTVDSASHSVTIDFGENGRTIDTASVTAQVCAALDAGGSTLALDYDFIAPDQEQLTSLLKELEQESEQAVIDPTLEYDAETATAQLHVGTPGYNLDHATASKAVAEAQASGLDELTIPLTETDPADYDLALYYDWLKREPNNSYSLINGELIGGEPGYDFDYDSASADLAAADYGDTVSIPIEIIEPQLSQEEAQWWLFHDRIGQSDTYHTADSARTTNLRLACAAIDGTVINPGEEFSFNGVVGERTAAKGYQYGIVYVNSSSEPQLGGGICQVATGCYQAALKAGMVITQREEHMFPVTYCAGGLDATVYWGSVDFRFRNPWSMPIRLNASVSGGQVHISIDGSNFTGHYIKLSSESLGGLRYRAYRTIYNPDGSVYYREDLGVSQ